VSARYKYFARFGKLQFGETKHLCRASLRRLLYAAMVG